MTKLAVVTGATGVVGKEIANFLLDKGVRVRILTRNTSFSDSRLEVVNGSLDDQASLSKLVSGADYLFHCAAELNDESKMWETNVTGTQNLIQAAIKSDIGFICHMSSVGVIGKIEGNYADESTPCSPMNMYEKSKLEAERILTAQNFQDKKIVILRPANVVTPLKNNFTGLSSLQLFLKGGENAHIVHARDVAAAAIYLMDNQPEKNETYIISCDEEKLNTFAGCVALSRGMKSGIPLREIKEIPHLPWRNIYLLRRLSKGPCNRGDICYSSKKLISTGFQYQLGFLGAIKDISENSQR